MCRLILLTALTISLAGHSYAATVISNGIEFGPGGFSGDYTLKVYSGPNVPAADYTSVWFDFDYDPLSRFVTLTGRNSNTDEGSSWYLVHGGDVLSPAAIAANNYPRMIGVGVGRFFFDSINFSPQLDFLLGRGPGLDDFYLGVGPPQWTGWVKLRVVYPIGYPNVPAKLEAVNSALQFGAQGIIVGSTTTVPEPSGWLVAATLAMLQQLGARARGKRRQSGNVMPHEQRP